MNRSASLFNQLLQQFPRSEFQRLVNKHQAEKGAKGFTFWAQFVSMIFPLRGTFGYASLPEQTFLRSAAQSCLLPREHAGRSFMEKTESSSVAAVDKIPWRCSRMRHAWLVHSTIRTPVMLSLT
ncbi:MAG: DUF4372 domain-containing protein [Candidatus Sabulitectum sp.]|nr:DUF4372 domain-containing protein [Candidatus Sabulitectum sp.]